MTLSSFYGAGLYGKRPYSYEPITLMTASSTVTAISSAATLVRVRTAYGASSTVQSPVAAGTAVRVRPFGAVSTIEIEATLASWPNWPPLNPGWSGGGGSAGIWTPVSPAEWG